MTQFRLHSLGACDMHETEVDLVEGTAVVVRTPTGLMVALYAADKMVDLRTTVEAKGSGSPATVNQGCEARLRQRGRD